MDVEKHNRKHKRDQVIFIAVVIGFPLMMWLWSLLGVMICK